jgi:NADPH:quinone reductase-like Zn-dependent oxidoreductase
MKQIWITKAGGPEVLEVRESDNPVPAPGEVLVEVKAAGVNFADIMARFGIYPDAPRIPCVVGYEVAGIVVSRGPALSPQSVGGRPGAGDHDELQPGDRVLAMTHFGGYSSMVAVPESQVFRLPDEMGFAEAASIPVNFFTAYLAAIRIANVQQGERILIHNAGGGVGTAAIQLANRAGATVYGTASAWKHDRLRELGAHELIDYRSHDWVRELLRRTNGAGVHAILDPIGGKNLRKDLRVLAPLGRLVSFGLTAPVRNGRKSMLGAAMALLRMPRPHLLSMISNNWSMAGLNLAHLWSEIDRLRAVGDAVLHAYAEGHVKPVIAAEVGFSDAGQAHRMMQERKNIGKIVLIP